MSVSLGRCRFVGVTARWLITYGYGGLQTGLSIDRVVGGPNWIGSTPFSVDATAGNDSATSAQLAEMVRTLLEQRFHLRFHRDARAVPGYALVVAKGGVKLRESADGAAAGPRIRPGSITGSMPAAGLAFALSRMLGTPVTDETGLTGQYDVALTWTPDAGDVRDPRADPADAAGPSVFAAVQEMGLRLERKQTSVEFFVVDSIEMPTPN